MTLDHPVPNPSGQSITAVLLVFQKRELACQVVAAILAQTVRPGRVIVVDNGSTDGSAAAIVERFPEVELIALPHNNGVGAGHNAGWRTALADPACDFIWALEHDCIPAPDCLEQLLKVSRRIAPLDSSRLPGVVFPAQFTPLHRMGRPTYVLAGLHFRLVRSLPHTCPPLTASFFTFNGTLLPTKTLRALGMLDENYFLGAEDADLSLRCRKARVPMLQVLAARVEHDHYRDLKVYLLGPWYVALPMRAEPFRIYYSHRNAVVHLIRAAAHPRNQALRLTVFFFVMMLRDLWLPQGWLRVIARLYALRDGLQGKVGQRDYAFMRGRGQTRP